MPETRPRSIRFPKKKYDRVTSLANALTGGDFSKCVHQLIDEGLQRRDMPIPDDVTHQRIEEVLLATKRLVPRLNEILIALVKGEAEKDPGPLNELQDDIRELNASSIKLIENLEHFFKEESGKGGKVMTDIIPKVLQVPVSLAPHIIKPREGKKYHEVITWGFNVSMLRPCLHAIKDAYKKEALISIRVFLNAQNQALAKESMDINDAPFRWAMIAALYHATKDPLSDGYNEAFRPRPYLR